MEKSFLEEHISKQYLMYKYKFTFRYILGMNTNIGT